MVKEGSATAMAQNDIREISRAEGMVVLNNAASHYLGMTAEAFLHAWDSGEF